MEKPPSLENIEAEIERLFEELRGAYHGEQFSEDLRGRIAREWDSVQAEIKGVERTPRGLEHARKLTRWFLNELSKIPKKEEGGLKEVWEGLKQEWEAAPRITLRDRSARGGAAIRVVNEGRDLGVPIEDIDKFVRTVISQQTENENHNFIYFVRDYAAATNDRDVKALGARAYRYFLKEGDTGSARDLAAALYGAESKEYKRVREVDEREEEEGYLSPVEISKDATFADLFRAIDAIEKDPGDLHFEDELWDNFNPEVMEEVLGFRDSEGEEKAATTKVLDFFRDRGYSQSDVSAYLPIKFSRARKTRKGK